MAANGIQEEYLFPNDSVSVLQTAHSAGIHQFKKKQKKRLSLFMRHYGVNNYHVGVKCHHNHNEYD